jgi:3-phenylpropionate/trans-cinnamate dioxygenase ferredoxin component
MAGRWVPVVAVADVTGPPWPCHDVAGFQVRIVRGVDRGLHAIGPACPHQDAPLDRAEVEGDQVLCPRHYYAYDATTGMNTLPGRDTDLALPVYPVRVVDGMVEVDLAGSA